MKSLFSGDENIAEVEAVNGAVKNLERRSASRVIPAAFIISAACRLRISRFRRVPEPPERTHLSQLLSRSLSRFWQTGGGVIAILTYRYVILSLRSFYAVAYYAVGG